MDVPELISPVNPPDNLARRAGCKCNRRSGVSDDSHAKSCPLFDSPSTPEPQGEKCAHAPEIQRYGQKLDFEGYPVGQVSRMDSGDMVLYEDHLAALRAVREERDTAMNLLRQRQDTFNELRTQLDAQVARERESRKQAEAALRVADKALHDLSTEEIIWQWPSKYWTETDCPGDQMWDAIHIVRAALSKPVQEPAERERGK